MTRSKARKHSAAAGALIARAATTTESPAQAQQIASLVDVVSLLVSRVPGAPMQMPHAEPARARAGHAAHSAAPRAAPAAEAAQPARPAAAAAPVASAGGGPATERPASGATRAASARGPSRRGGLPARVGDTSLRRSFVLSIPVARGANWFLAGGGRRMDEEEATAAAAERIAAAAEDGTSLPVRLATDVVRFLYGGTGRREPADGGVVSASLLNAKPAVGGIGVEPRGGGVLRVLFTVASDAVANTVVCWRHELRRCVDSTAVFNVLSDCEEAQHQALWPAFLLPSCCGCSSQCLLTAGLVATMLMSLLLSVAALALALDARGGAAADAGAHAAPPPMPMQPQPTFVPVSRIAFGSCTSHDLRPQPIWRTVVGAAPDVWIWVGDMAYTDVPSVDCAQVPLSPQCICTLNFLHSSAGECFAGDLDHIRDRFNHQVNLPDYRAFLTYMCPGSETRAQWPPTGSDPSACQRAVLGTYDDHDSGWNNGNGRMPAKHAVKNLFLDAIGEPAGSVRRSSTTGLQAAFTLYGPQPDSDGDSGSVGPLKSIDRSVHVVLLDERFDRDPLPCERRRAWCEGVLGDPGAAGPGADAWCTDFLRDDRDSGGGALGGGSCCARDEALAAWCDTPAGAPARAAREMRRWRRGAARQGDLWPWLVSRSPVCEVLGPSQRAWLARELSSSASPLHIIASGSVVAGSVGFVGTQGACSGDDWECYKPAQANLLHSLTASATTGCVLVLTGDYHYSDIKLVRPGSGTGYSSSLQTASLARPLWQFMASGMSPETARHSGTDCKGSYREDLVGLRPLGACSYYSDPNFGVVDIDWDKRTVSLKILDGSSGDVANDAGGARQEVVFSLDTCLPA
ncbi:hypothetical protein FOA52_016201 [Chlamydomonas sp. UWO 241]|nr:hypothetical protein FOA52_016201 [Chlamydomonas sp. UWO 241]